MIRILLLYFLASLSFIGCQRASDATSILPKTEAAPVHQTASTQPGNPYYSRTDISKLNVSDEEWKKVLPPVLYAVAREKDTERAFTGKLWNFTGKGTYYCAACGNKLFRSDAKFASDCGWPSFFETSRKEAVRYVEDNSYGMERIEVLCGRCDGHLGHLFDDGPAPTYKRYCMNSVSLDFEPDNALQVK